MYAYKSRPSSVKPARLARVGEKKVIDILLTSYAVENTGTQLQLLNGVAPGTNINNRIGRKLSLKSLQIRGVVAFTDNTTANPSFLRMVIVYDKQANAAAPTFANIMTSQDIAGTTETNAFSMVNLNNRDRFEVIRDKVIEMGVIDTTATQTFAVPPASATINEYIKLGNRETIYNAGTAGTVADIVSGSLFIFFICPQANATGVTAQCCFRTRFLDQ